MKILICSALVIMTLLTGCADLTGDVFFNRKHQCGIWDHGRWDGASYGENR